MTMSDEELAHQTLTAKAPQGYLIASVRHADAQSGTHWVFASDLVSPQDRALLEVQDPLATWMQQSYGAVELDELLDGISGTAVSFVVAGAKLTGILLHETGSLSEEERNEAKAAVSIIYSDIETDAPEDLTLPPKEAAYLRKLVTGNSDDEIAEELKLTLRATKERKRRSIEATKSDNITHAVGKAIRKRLI